VTRRALFALLLIGAALGLLHLLIGFENFAKVESGPGDEPIRRTADERGIDGGLKVGGGDGETPAISVSGSGEFRETRREERVLADGSRLRLRVYELTAEDSETVAEDLVRLDRVDARFFQIDDDADPPREVHVATITARQAFLQLGRDEQGKPSVLEDRDVDLRDVVVASTAEAEVRGLRLEVARLLVRQTEQGIEFRTPTAEVPLLIELAGDEGLTTLRGLGVRGILPPHAGAENALLEIHITSQPELVHGSSSIRARGRLDYVEDFGAGVGDFALADEIVIEGMPGETGDSVPSVARGQRLAGRILRGEAATGTAGLGDRGSRRSGWRELRLEGAGPRRVELVRDALRLTCDRLHVLPAFGGEPAMFVAEGEPEISDPTRALADSPRLRAGERIHLIDLPRLLAPLHAPFGYPRPDFGRLAGRLLVFEGPSTLRDPERGLELEAAGGLRLLQSADQELSMLVGSGAVVLRGADLSARGPDGFVLRQVGDRQWIRLGPSDPDPAHRFVAERETADGRLRIEGSGACRFERAADGSTRVLVESPAEDLAVERGGDALRQVAALDATVSPANELLAFAARGARARIETTVPARDGRPAERLVGEAREIHKLGLAGVRLLGDAVVTRAAGHGRATGDLVEIHRSGRDELIVVARGANATVRSTTTAGAETGGEPREVELQGRDLRVLPGILPRALVALHGIDPRLATVTTGRIALASGSVTAVVRDAAGVGTTEATGERLAMRIDDSAAVLDGRTAVVETLTEDGHRLVARAPRIRVLGGDPSARRVVLLPDAGFTPSLEVHGGSGSEAFRSFRITCQVPIEADDVGVRIDGPFAVRGLDPAGEVQPDGLWLDAESLRLTWLPGTYSVGQLVARGEAVLRYRGVVGFGDEMRVDAPRTLLEVESLSATPAGVELRGRRLEGDLFRVDYEAMRVQAWGLRGAAADRDTRRP
jgi:hypothetical protein